GRVDGLDVADVAEVAAPRVDPGPGHKQQAVLARHTHGQAAVGVDPAHQGLVDPPDQHHAGQVHGLGVGDPVAVDEHRLLAEARHQLADLGPAAVDDDHVHAHVAEQDHVVDEGAEPGRAHGRPPDLTPT